MKSKPRKVLINKYCGLIVRLTRPSVGDSSGRGGVWVPRRAACVPAVGCPRWRKSASGTIESDVSDEVGRKVWCTGG